jgi:uncharacterized protein
MQKKQLPINKDQAIALLDKLGHSEIDMLHYIETESIMRSLAEKLGEDPDYWGMLGLLHDVDWSLTKNNISQHCIKAKEILTSNGFGSEDIETIQSHAYGHEEIPGLKDKKRTQKMEFALAAGETVTGLIYAYALMRGKKISGMEPEKLKKKFKDKSFAAGCNRDIIKEIENTGLTLEEFFEIAIKAMQAIKDRIGLQ